MTSSASKPAAPTRAIPSSSSASTIIGSCASSSGGVSLDVLAAFSSRCALYDGIAATRNAGRQSSSQQATSRRGRRRVTRCAIMSSSRGRR
jgi:hypothetical protein